MSKVNKNFNLSRYKHFFGIDVINFIDKNLSESWINSAKTKIHLDEYIKNKNAPTIVFSHGIAGFGRLLTPYAYKLYEAGFNVILPDLKGYGFNKGLRGHWSFSDLVENIVDSYYYAKEKYNENVFIAGGSMGGAIAYHTACQLNDLKAVACYCLFDFNDEEFIKASSNYGFFTPLIKKILTISALFIPKLTVPATTISSFNNLSDNDEFNKTVENDPLAGNKISLKAIKDLLSFKLPIPFLKYNKAPILIIQPEKDRMTPPKFSKKAYKLIKAKEKKFIVLKDRGHWVIDSEGVEIICKGISSWFYRFL